VLAPTGELGEEQHPEQEVGLAVSRPCLFLALVGALVAASTAQASVPHTVEPGETLFSIAAASNLTTRSLAVANGLPEDAQLLAGSTVEIPSEPEAAAALARAGVTAPSAGVGSGAPEPLGAYSVRPGDTLSGIAARSGISTGQLAWMNGVDPSDPLLVGTALKLPTGSPLASQQAPQPAVPEVVPQAEPYATAGRVSATQIGQVAAAHSVSPSLAAAVAWQESGFNNGFVSSANARGVMQILPGTWTWVQQRLADRSLDPSSALDNVHAGVMYLGQLLSDAGGNEALAIASYYQGSSSVQDVGMLPDTQRYVRDVMALRARFGGP
jgi:soluble lytic murein transglycosylase-like protein